MRAGWNLNRRTATSAVLLCVALVAIAVLWFTADARPQPLLFLVFAVPFVWLEIHSVEVNDKLRISSSIMVLLSAGVVFESGTRALGMALMAGLWPFVPADFRERRVFFPVVNFSQAVLAAAAAGLTLDILAPADVGTAERLVGTAGAAG